MDRFMVRNWQCRWTSILWWPIRKSDLSSTQVAASPGPGPYLWRDRGVGPRGRGIRRQNTGSEIRQGFRADRPARRSSMWTHHPVRNCWQTGPQPQCLFHFVVALRDGVMAVLETVGPSRAHSAEAQPESARPYMTYGKWLQLQRGTSRCRVDLGKSFHACPSGKRSR